MTLTTYVKIIQIGGGSPILNNYHWYEMNYSQKIHLVFKVDRSSRRRQT